MRKSNRYDPPPIAVVGISAIFPDAINIQHFWNNILTGKDSITDVPPNYWLVEDYYDPDPLKKGKTYARRGAFLPKVNFDPTEFWLPPKTLANIDTVQLLSLIAARDVLNDCRSVQSEKVDRKRISVILGSGAATDMMFQMAGQIQKPNWVKAMRDSGLPENMIDEITERASQTYTEWTENSFPGALGNVTAGRIANRLNLGGTNCIVDAACASSLGAVGMAIQELQLGHSDLAISGGADASNDIFTFMCFSKTPALSPTGDCRPFSDKADGTMLGEGVGMVALRRLEDAERDGDNIYALIRGIGSSSDGMAKSIYAPLAEGQALAIQRAFESAGFSPQEVELVEAHGTATKANDAAEFDGLCRVFDKGANNRRQWCALGSIKSQIGHTKTASGAASLIKTVLALHHKVLPPTIKVDKLNPDLDFGHSPFYLNTAARPWTHESETSRKASLSAFGFGGSNFHLALEEYCGSGEKANRFYTSPEQLLLLSADDFEGIDRKAQELQEKIKDTPLTVLARKGQETFTPESKYRLALLANNSALGVSLIETARQRIRSKPGLNFSVSNKIYYGVGVSMPKIAFLFSGQGSQYLNMGCDLAIEFEVARSIWDSVAALYHNDVNKLHQVVFPIPVFDDESGRRQTEYLNRTEFALPAIGAVSMSQLNLLDSIGLKADCIAGHGCGEIAALIAAGALTRIEDVIQIYRTYGKLMAQATCAMTAVTAPLAKTKKLLKDWKLSVTFVNINTPCQVVLSGDLDEIEKLEKKLNSVSINFQRLPLSKAFHPRQANKIADRFHKFLDSINFKAPKIKVYANSTATPYCQNSVQIRKTLVGQITQPVLFKDIVDAMYMDGIRVFLEVGPASNLTQLVDDCLGGRDHIAVMLDQKNHNGVMCFWNAIGMLAAAGIGIQYKSLWKQYAETIASGDKKGHPVATIKIDGSNYGKPYPPKEGASALPKPVPDSPVTTWVQKLIKTAAKLPAENADLFSGYDEDAIDISLYQDADQKKRVSAQRFMDTLFKAHKDFQKAQTETHMALIRSAEKAIDQLEELAPAGRLKDATGKLLSAFRMSDNLNDEALMNRKISNEVISETSENAKGEEAEANENKTKISAEVIKDADLFKQVMLQIVAEKTGYPEEVLDFDTDLESGFGIDSIKKVEILSDFQDRFQDVLIKETEALFRLNTLREILEYVKKMVVSSENDRTETVANSKSDEDGTHIRRYTVQSEPAPAGSEDLTGLNTVEHIYIVSDNKGVASILSQKLKEKNIHSTVVRRVPKEAQAVLFMQGIDDLSGNETIDAAIELNRSAFKIARKCGRRVQENGGVFISVQDTHGDFGLSGTSGSRAWSAGLGALAKTAAKEWPKAFVKAIDVNCNQRGSEDIAQSILRELLNGGQEVEVGLKEDGQRYIVGTTPCELTQTTRPLPDGSVVLVSGGARGITAACLKALALRSRLKFAIIGRTESFDEPEHTSVCETGHDIRQALNENVKRQGRKIAPQKLDLQTRKILSSREVRANIDSLIDSGSSVKYFPADIRDPDAVKHIVADIHEEWGDIHILIHAAGVISDRPICNKTLAQFDEVFTTKVLGFRNLLSATCDDPLTRICCFSSVVARSGNIRQVDYAMANEILNKVCQIEANRRNARCGVKAINWGPWEAGMVGPQHKSYFGLIGYKLISLAEGARQFVREMEDGPNDGPVEIILSA